MKQIPTFYEDLMNEYQKDLIYRNKLKQKIQLQNMKCEFTKKFLYSIVKEQNTKEVTECYKKKLKDIRKSIRPIRFPSTEREKSILEYSFLNVHKNKKKIRKIDSVPNNLNTTKIRSSIRKINNNELLKNFTEKNCFKKQENKISSNNSTIINQIRKSNYSNKIFKNNKSISFINNDSQIFDIKNDLKKTSIKKKIYYEKIKPKVNNEERFKKWYKLEAEYEKIRKLKLEIIKNEADENRKIIENEEKKQETFRPQINKKSIQIFNKNYSNMDFNDRLNKIYSNKKIKDLKNHKLAFAPSSYTERTKMQTQEKLLYLI